MTKKTFRKTGSRLAPVQKTVLPPPLAPRLKSAATIVSVSSVQVKEAIRPVSAARWIGTGQLALRCGVSSQTIRNDIERGKIMARQTGSGRYVIPRAEADRYILKNGYSDATAPI